MSTNPKFPAYDRNHSDNGECNEDNRHQCDQSHYYVHSSEDQYREGGTKTYDYSNERRIRQSLKFNIVNYISLADDKCNINMPMRVTNVCIEFTCTISNINIITLYI